MSIPGRAIQWIRRLLQPLLEAGIHEGLDPDDRRAVFMVNVCALVGAVVAWLNIPSFARYLPGTASLCWILGAAGTGFALVVLLNWLRYHLVARLLIGAVLVFQSGASSLITGLESKYHLFPLMAFIGAYFVTPPRHQSWLVPIGLGLGAVSLGLEIAAPVPVGLDPTFLHELAVANVGALLIFSFIMCGFNYVTIHAYQAELVKERQKSDALLLNILPEPVAAQLRAGSGSIADRFEDTTILFADIVNFTAWSAQENPSRVVAVLDAVFSDFDALTERHGLEKIKTIGDAYMVAGGVPERSDTHCEAMANLALDMMETFRAHHGQGDATLGLRIGIHRGPTVAGVIGRRKFSYDLWGDSVNLASRMESHGRPGAIQVTRQVADSLHDTFELERRGVIEVKGRGEVETWFLLGRKAPTGAVGDPALNAAAG